MSYSENNLKKVEKYWDDFKKSGQHKSMGRCYYALSGGTFGCKISSFTNTLYCQTTEERSICAANAVFCLWSEEIDFIFINRRVIRKDSSVSFSQFELFKWMKKQSPIKYEKFKNEIKTMLEKISTKGTFTEAEVKMFIAKKIYSNLGNEFVKL